MHKLLFFVVLLFSNSIYAQHRGIVFIDDNASKELDTNEAGMEGVVVSDGYSVFKTDARGVFNLTPNPKARFLFITVPSGYKSSTAHYLKIDPKVERYDFGLVLDESQQKDYLRFIQITDTESSLYGSWIDNIRNYAQYERASVIMHTGDICYEPGMRFHAAQVNSNLMGRATYYAVGNHDLVKGEYGEKLFEDLFGPVYYSFEAGPAHFVVTPMSSGDYAPSYTQDQVISWLKKDLALKDKNKPLIFINHDLIVGKDFVLKGKSDSIDLKGFNLKAYLYGHWHNNYVYGQSNDVMVISTNAPNKGGIDHSAGQFLVIDVDTDGVKQVVPKYPNLKNHMEVVYPTANNRLVMDDKKMAVSANVYDSERAVSSVKVSVYDNGNRVAVDDLVQKSDWNWRGALVISSAVQKRDLELLWEVNYSDGSQTLKKSSLQQNIAAQTALRLSWSTNVGGNIWKVSPLVQGKYVFSATMDDTGSGKAKIVAMEKSSGKILWEYGTKNSIKQKLRYSEGLVLATDVGGCVYAIEESSGKLVWKKELSGGRLPSYVTAGAVKDGVYFSGMGNYLSAIRVKDGELIWQNGDWNGGEALPGEMLTTAEHLVTGANWNALFVHDIKTGKLIWKKSEDGLRFRSGGASVDENGLFVAGLNSLFLLDERTGNVLTQKKYEEDLKVMASPLLTDDQLILPTSLNGVKGYNKADLEEQWSFRTGEALIYTSSYSTPDLYRLVGTVESSVVRQGNKLLFGASDGFFYVLDLNGKLVEKINIGAPILAEPTLFGDSVFIADFAGNIYSFDFLR